LYLIEKISPMDSMLKIGLGIALSFSLLANCKESAKNDMTFSEREFDFGSHAAGDTVSHVFKIKNNGQKILQIMAIESSCSCTVADWTRSGIPSGQEGRISIQMIVRDTGYVRSSVVVQVNRDSVFYPLFLVANKKRPGT